MSFLTTQLPLDRCPHCQHELTATTAIDGEHKPAPGGFTVCAYCACILSFDNDLKLQYLTSDNVAWLKDNEDVRDRLAKAQKTCLENLSR